MAVLFYNWEQLFYLGLDQLLELVKIAQGIGVEAGARRIVSVIKIDYSPDGVWIDEKIGKYRT